MTMVIRPYQEEDRPGVELVLEQSWSRDTTMRELHNLHGPRGDVPWRRTLVIEADGEIMAVGSVRLGQRHPARYWLALNVAPQWRRQGLGSQLLAELHDLTQHDPRPFRVQARPSDRQTMRFLQQRGFRGYMQTWEGVIDPRDAIVTERLAGMAAYAGHVQVAHPRGEVLRRALPQIALFYEDWYHAIHAWDPPARWSSEQALAHFCGPDLIAGSVTCLYRGDELIGVGSLIVPPFGDQSNEVYLVQCGVRSVEHPDAQRLVARLVTDSVAFAAKQGKRIRFEVDTTHPDLWHVLEDLPLRASDRDFMLLADDPSGCGQVLPPRD